MGEMIKFGIKLALTIACAAALVAALVLLFNAIPSISGSGAINEIFYFITLFLPINMNPVFYTLGLLFSFKVAYWAADKMIQFINALG